VLESARETLPSVSFVRNNLGVAYERTGRLAEAVSEYRAAVEGGDPLGKAEASIARLATIVNEPCEDDDVPPAEEVAATTPADPEKDPR
jgi:hypothetical protein